MAEKMSGQDGGKNGVGGVKTFVIGMREDGCCSQKWRGWSGKRREVREKMAGVGGAESEEREDGCGSPAACAMGRKCRVRGRPCLL